jgi:hypothetical protein
MLVIVDNYIYIKKVVFHMEDGREDQAIQVVLVQVPTMVRINLSMNNICIHFQCSRCGRGWGELAPPTFQVCVRNF